MYSLQTASERAKQPGLRQSVVFKLGTVRRQHGRVRIRGVVAGQRGDSASEASWRFRGIQVGRSIGLRRRHHSIGHAKWINASTQKRVARHDTITQNAHTLIIIEAGCHFFRRWLLYGAADKRERWLVGYPPTQNSNRLSA